MLKKSFILVLVLLTSVAYAESPKASFKVELSPAGSFEGKTKAITGYVKFIKGQLRSSPIKVDLRTLKTGIELRDDHTKKRLIVNKKNPYAVLRGVKGKSGKGVGVIEIKGIKKKVSFTYKKHSDNLLLARFQLNLKDFNIKDVRYMGVGVKDIINLQAMVPIKK